MSASVVSPAPPTDAVRRRLIGTLFVGSGLNRTGYLLAVTVMALAAEELLGSARWSGLPAAVTTIGIAVGTVPLSALMARTGRRPGTSIGLVVSALAALTAAGALAIESFFVLTAATFVFGFGAAADRLARYAAADVSDPNKAGSAIAAIVWAGTVGSVVGPSLLRPAQSFAESLGLPGLAGAFLFAAAFLTVSAAVIWMALRPDPLTFAPRSQDADEQAVPWEDVRRAARRPNVWYAAVALVVGQLVMVVIMAMTPIHIRNAGLGLESVGLVISAHTFGMFALSPLTGWLTGRIGLVRVIVIGQIMLIASAVIAMPLQGDDTSLLVVALWLLGLGWNFGFVAGSALVTEGLTGALRLRIQGLADTLVWTSGAVAALSSGIVLDWGGYGRLALIGAVVSAVALATRLRYRPAAAPVRV